MRWTRGACQSGRSRRGTAHCVPEGWCPCRLRRYAGRDRVATLLPSDAHRPWWRPPSSSTEQSRCHVVNPAIAYRLRFRQQPFSQMIECTYLLLYDYLNTVNVTKIIERIISKFHCVSVNIKRSRHTAFRKIKILNFQRCSIFSNQSFSWYDVGKFRSPVPQKLIGRSGKNWLAFFSHGWQ